MKFLLSVITLCLVMITAKLYIPEAQAKVGGMDRFALMGDDDFNRAVRQIVEARCLSSGSYASNKITCS